ncbi:hypothetical protein NDA11_003593 [Ustilago hordei]|nr:hypothetical protein NDA11_003593 [Ustilago hordei]UTT87995.1 hypothetical protein NDA17_000738 [Ustilago hordei]
MLTWATNDNQDSRVDLNHQDKEEPGLWLQHNIEPQYEVHQQQEPDVSPAQEQHDLSTTRSYSNTLDPTVQQPRETEPADPYETHDSVANTSAAIDPPCSDTAATTTKAQLLGILVKVLTGDTVTITKGTCKMLALGTKVYNSHHPIEMLQHHGHLTAMTGDSVNDASSLKKIECGTTIKGASDTTRSSADVVSLNKGISTIITLIKKLTKRQSMHDNNLPTSKNRDTFLKLIHGHSKKHRMGTQVALQFHGGVVESRNLQDIDKVSELMIDFTHTELCSTQMHWFNRCIPHTIIILDEVICSNLLEAYAKEVVCDLPKGQ